MLGPVFAGMHSHAVKYCDFTRLSQDSPCICLWSSLSHSMQQCTMQGFAFMQRPVLSIKCTLTEVPLAPASGKTCKLDSAKWLAGE